MYIGPSICQECYEVSEDVIEEFEKVLIRNTGTGCLQKRKRKISVKSVDGKQDYFSGSRIPEENISMPNLCTCCNPEFLFSHRASHGKRGNLGAFLAYVHKT